MWILICGAPATCKNTIADMLQRDKFQILSIPLLEGVDVATQLMISRISQQLDAKKLQHSADIVTVGSAWEQAEIYSEIELDRHLITQHQYDQIKFFYKSMLRHFEPPSAVIWTRAEKMTSFERASLRGKTIDEEYYNAVCKGYEKFIEKIKVPIIEIPVSQSVEKTSKEVEFSVASIRSAKLSEQTIWKKTFFRDEE
jgi:dephospho-CoA kinase